MPVLFLVKLNDKKEKKLFSFIVILEKEEGKILSDYWPPTLDLILVPKDDYSYVDSDMICGEAL